MRAAWLACVLLAGACGGSAPPPKPPEPAVSTTPATRVPVEEDEPEDGVSFVGSRGKMDIEAIEAGIDPHKQALSECYLENVKRRRWLGGQILLHWEIDKEGTVTSVRLDDLEPGMHLGNWPIEKCLLGVARQAVFAKPVGGDADFQIPLEFTAKGRAAQWTEDQALRAVGGQTVKLDACAKGKVPKPDGVTITLYVGPGGKAQSVGFTSKSPIDDAWADCAEKTAMSWRLPDPRGVIAKLTITYH
ncbi:MAG TPA: AgmX/PglI C-terminal domain-containing protein [Kofleriaceae bacterium]|nr:AgmX/PglI C-terminal domain-containing protein [Kofleriaceae bacterium]